MLQGFALVQIFLVQLFSRCGVFTLRRRRSFIKDKQDLELLMKILIKLGMFNIFTSEDEKICKVFVRLNWSVLYWQWLDVEWSVVFFKKVIIVHFLPQFAYLSCPSWRKLPLNVHTRAHLCLKDCHLRGHVCDTVTCERQLGIVILCATLHSWPRTSP